jgi:thiol-disulfide isomerase/thioredoxin
MVSQPAGTVRLRKSLRASGVLTVLTVLSVLGVRPAHAQFDAGIPLGTRAPAVVINDLEGQPVDLGALIGSKPMVLEFWATWCSLCKALLPQLQAVQNTFGDRVVLLGINVTVNDSKARIRRYLEEHKPPFRVLYDEKGVGARAYDVPATSFIVVVDPSGKVVYTGSGAQQDVVAAVRKALGRS